MGNGTTRTPYRNGTGHFVFHVAALGSLPSSQTAGRCFPHRHSYNAPTGPGGQIVYMCFVCFAYYVAGHPARTRPRGNCRHGHRRTATALVPRTEHRGRHGLPAPDLDQAPQAGHQAADMVLDRTKGRHGLPAGAGHPDGKGGHSDDRGNPPPSDMDVMPTTRSNSAPSSSARHQPSFLAGRASVRGVDLADGRNAPPRASQAGWRNGIRNTAGDHQHLGPWTAFCLHCRTKKRSLSGHATFARQFNLILQSDTDCRNLGKFGIKREKAKGDQSPILARV